MLKILTRPLQMPQCAGTIVSARVRNKSGKVGSIEQLMREEKRCFGRLLETTSRKRKRLAREKKKGIVNIAKTNNEPRADSELSWTLNACSKVRSVRFTFASVVESPAGPMSAASKLIKANPVAESRISLHSKENADVADSFSLALDDRASPGINKRIIKRIQPVVEKRFFRKYSTHVSAAESTVSFLSDRNKNNANISKNCLDGRNLLCRPIESGPIGLPPVQEMRNIWFYNNESISKRMKDTEAIIESLVIRLNLVYRILVDSVTSYR